jgi:hypothetical protein
LPEILSAVLCASIADSSAPIADSRTLADFVCSTAAHP